MKTYRVLQVSSGVLLILFVSLLVIASAGQKLFSPTSSTPGRQDIIQTAVAGTVVALTQNPDNNTNPVEPTQTLAPTNTPASTSTPTLTPVIDLTPLPTVEALVIDIPTPGPLPVSAWRPPLYPVPWALTDEDHFYFIRPIGADTINWPVSDYKYGGIVFGPDTVHTGIDIDAPKDSPVLAAADGKVIWAGYGLLAGVEDAKDDYGLAVAIQHDFGYKGERLYTLYAHMGEINVVDNQYVEAGDVLGKVGSTGESTGPHLHFEVRLGKNLFWNTRNPELWIAPPQGWGVLAARIMDESGKPLNHVVVSLRNRETGKIYEVRTYGGKTVNADDYYNENLVMGDLPAGSYILWVDYPDNSKYHKFDIHPGAVTFITYWGSKGFEIKPTPTLSLDFLPTDTP
jgi:murein DD-endopeptidase MepM/ murein hydrolase activator NlpD